MDDLTRAYAVLGLRPGVLAGEVRRRYRALARTWHPDRYATDPKGQAEAAMRMRAINGAYATVTHHLRRVGARQPSESRGVPTRPRGSRLSRDEIDAMVNAIGSEGPVDAFLGAVGWVGGTLEGLLAAFFAAALLVRAAMIFWSGDFRKLVEEPEVPLFLAAILLLGVQEYRKRRRLED
jgi:DnaJ domain